MRAQHCLGEASSLLPLGSLSKRKFLSSHCPARGHVRDGVAHDLGASLAPGEGYHQQSSRQTSNWSPAFCQSRWYRAAGTLDRPARAPMDIMTVNAYDSQ